jgi:uncharacterized protein YndB with AHSA1/START domain
VVSHERLVFTFEFEDTPGHVLLVTETFAEHDGKTWLANQSIFQSVADRDEMIQSGIEAGATESRQRLAELLEKGKKCGIKMRKIIVTEFLTMDGVMEAP